MFTKFSVVFITLIFLSPVCGDEASGQYSLNFGAPASIWDISGDYEDIIGGFTLNYTIISDPEGRFEGLGTFDYEDNNANSFNGNFTFSGKVRSAKKVVRVRMRSKLSGTGVVSGDEADFDATIAGRIRKRLEIDPASLQLAGKAAARFRIDAPGFVRTNGSVRVPDFTSDIPLGMDGTWELTMNVFPNNSNYTGNATIDLSNDAQYGFLLSGRHLRNDLSKFRLKGDESSPRARFSLTTIVTNDEMFAQSLRGKILGQQIRLKQ